MSRRSIWVLAAAVPALFVVPTLAADVKSASVAVVSASPDWAGVYGGLIGGYSRSLSSQNLVGSVFNTGNYRVNGGLAGVDFGFNYQFGKWVIGLDTEIDKAALTGSKGQDFSSSFSALVMTRGRVGYSVGNFLPYIGLGPAYGEFASSANFPGAPRVAASQTRAGWSFSAGLDYMITPNLWARGEYSYICFGQSIVDNVDNIRFMGNYFRLGLDYKLDVPGLHREGADAGGELGDGAYNWAAFYVGPSIGGAATGQRSAFKLNDASIGAVTSPGAGGIVGFGLQGTVGVEAGVNWQKGRYVFGAETDVHESQLSGQGAGPRFDASSGGLKGTLSQIDTINQQGSARLRAGLALDRWLIYGTGGVAYAAFNSSSTFTAPGLASKTGLESILVGPVAGVGVERAIWKNWTAKFEYMYADFGAANFSFKAPAPFGQVGSRIGVSEHILRAGFNFMVN